MGNRHGKRITVRPLLGPASAYTTLRTPASMRLTGPSALFPVIAAVAVVCATVLMLCFAPRRCLPVLPGRIQALDERRIEDAVLRVRLDAAKGFTILWREGGHEHQPKDILGRACGIADHGAAV